MDHFCETIYESDRVAEAMEKDYQMDKQEKSEQKICDSEDFLSKLGDFSSKKDILDRLTNVELYTLYINKYISIEEAKDFKKLLREDKRDDKNEIR